MMNSLIAQKRRDEVCYLCLDGSTSPALLSLCCGSCVHWTCFAAFVKCGHATACPICRRPFRQEVAGTTTVATTPPTAPPAVASPSVSPLLFRFVPILRSPPPARAVATEPLQSTTGSYGSFLYNFIMKTIATLLFAYLLICSVISLNLAFHSVRISASDDRMQLDNVSGVFFMSIVEALVHISAAVIIAHLVGNNCRQYLAP